VNTHKYGSPKVLDAVNIYEAARKMNLGVIGTAVNSPFDDHESEDNWEYCIVCEAKKRGGFP
jgi:hypothetical protein